MTTIPTHQVKAIFNQNGQHIQTSKIKFRHEGDEPVEATARTVVIKFLTSLHKKPKPFTIETLQVTALKPAKLGAKLNKQHDYISLKATFLDGSMTLTSSWGGIKLSGDFVGHPATKEIFDASIVYEKRTKKNMASAMDPLLETAQSVKTFEEFSLKAQGVLATLE